MNKRSRTSRKTTRFKRPPAVIQSRGKVAFLLDEMYEDSELEVPLEALTAAGYTPVVIGRRAGSHLEGKRGDDVVVDLSIDEARPGDFAALVIPGGYSPDRLRMDDAMVAFTRAMYEAGKPVAAVCHGPSLLIEADLVDDKTVTSWPSIKTDLLNAGATWVDLEVVEDDNLITSRNPKDLPAFSEAILRQLEREVASPVEPPTEPLEQQEHTLH